MTSVFGADAHVRRCPFPYFDELRNGDGLTFVPEIEAYVVARHADVMTVLRDPGMFSSAQPMGPLLVRQERTALAALIEAAPDTRDLLARLRPRRTPVLLACDPPEHRRQRALVSAAFTPRRVAALQPMIEETAHGLIDGFGSKVDLVAEFCVPLPISVIAWMLGVDASDRDRFKRWSDDYIRMFGNHGLDVAEMAEVLQSQADLFDYLEAEIENRRQRPREDVITDVLNARSEGHDPFTVEEMLAIFGQFLVAGNETTTSLIASAALHLCARPELIERLRGDDDAIAAFVEEALRLEAPAQGFFRMATRDSTLSGTPIKRGDHLFLLYASANRDTAVFHEAELIDLERQDVGRHLGFGFGEHFCVGSGLGRLEARVAIKVLLDRLETIELATDSPLQYAPSYIKRSIESLPIRVWRRS